MILLGGLNLVQMEGWYRFLIQAISVSSDKTLKVWDLQSHRILKNWEFHNDSIFSLSVSDNFTKIVTGGKNGEIYLTDLAKGAYTKVDNVRDPVISLALKSYNDFAIYASTSGNKLYEYVIITNFSQLKRNQSQPKNQQLMIR
jgi:WD40 repeat protein